MITILPFCWYVVYYAGGYIHFGFGGCHCKHYLTICASSAEEKLDTLFMLIYHSAFSIQITTSTIMYMPGYTPFLIGLVTSVRGSLSQPSPSRVIVHLLPQKVPRVAMLQFQP